MKILAIILIATNLLSFMLMWADKRRAINGKDRISEKTLLISGFFLGGLGLLLGAVICHHKTRKLKFQIGIPCAILINCLILVIVLSAFIAFDVKGDIVYSYDGETPLDEGSVQSLKSEEYQCALVLGCAVYADGTPSPMLKDRLDTGIMLYKEGIVPKLLLSGDHGQVEYNEIGCMYNYCLDNGIPEEDIFLDHAGFSTYDSMYRAKSIFCVERMIVVTQTYHEFRALYVAKNLGVEAVGIASDQQHYFGASYREFREVLARDKDFFKVLMKSSPTFGGEEIPITGSSEPSHA